MEEEKKEKEGIPFIVVIVVLFVNLLVYKWSDTAGGLFFVFFGMWFLGLGIYKILKFFNPNL